MVADPANALTAGLALLSEANQEMTDGTVTALAAQCPSDAPHLVAFYTRYFKEQGRFPVPRKVAVVKPDIADQKDPETGLRDLTFRTVWFKYLYQTATSRSSDAARMRRCARRPVQLWFGLLYQVLGRAAWTLV